MSDYKTVKEAFVSNNPGQNVWTINSISLVALSSYALYASLVGRTTPNVIVDYLTTVLPLLLSITIFSSHSIIFNLAILSLVFLISILQPRGKPNQHIVQEKEKGEWLDESDSDEEPSQPAAPTPTSPFVPGHAALPSQVLSAQAQSQPLSRSSSGLSVGEPFSARKRRHSPTPSTHTHLAIDILATPEVDSTSLGNGTVNYPTQRLEWERGENEGKAGRLPFLSVYRAHMMIMTVHCILAVDFNIFPRSQGKCEDFGTSLMDVGVGSFVFSLGLVSSRSFLPHSITSPPTPVLSQVLRAMKKSAPVLLLGLVRVIMVKGSDYPEHVTEYGVHWNFFFTLGLMPIFGILLRPLRETKLRWSILGLLIATVHQLSLHYAGIQTWVLSPLRNNLLSQNKEGLVSLPGYLSIYLLGLAAGEHILRFSQSVHHTISSYSPLTSIPPYHNSTSTSMAPFPFNSSSTSPSSSSSTSTSSPNPIPNPIHSFQINNQTIRIHREKDHEKRRTELSLELFSYSLTFWLAFYLVTFITPVSRRMANLSYVLWISAYNTSFLLGYLLIEILFFSFSPQTITSHENHFDNRGDSLDTGRSHLETSRNFSETRRNFVNQRNNPEHSTSSSQRDDKMDKRSPGLLEAINRNGLIIFLVANLLTGLINLSMETIYVKEGIALIVLVGYSAGICLIAWFLRGLRLRL
ncbi:hypothetical protein TREMEDRAFT_58415 [Tremella mesenterica DSM 1558]|uniref:uncharacterized protein n=1 Tax=Tremella mesenterica (strain ATCC 24925 / CBS 8224 / DSM 1558 / NBRC 9311 / NRRL Y-6157 / RJB 2259-6 / UBC 559-6) TaxID=578456 RepID=UPI0003F49A63|nr:uncharacterized protein TREMEDRAFT_58415 [Tremella mesenterica DSM 1558]EIW72255.1 hypothetical protein TREMEDRAFT_58415 [Tremella mesenterica DSM 1558]